MSNRIDFQNEDFIRNPFPAYHEAREREPVYSFLLPSGQYAWMVTSYDDALKILDDPRFVTNPPYLNELENKDAPAHLAIVSRNLLSVNPADHRRLRRLVQKAFTPRMAERLRGRIEEISNSLLDQVEGIGEMRLIEDFAFPLPIIVICEMLGIPVKDQDKFRTWSDAIMESVHHPRFDNEGEEAMKAFVDYLHDLIALRRTSMQEDLISDLISAEDEGDKLSEHELYALVFVLIIAGHETTVNLIGNGVLALLQHPEQNELLQHRPELIGSAIEEILRYNGPAEVSNTRWTTEDVEFGGKYLRKGDMVFVSFSSANRDDRKFEDPDVFDITRMANNHIAFGKGVHYCLGAPLARLEGEIAIGALMRRMPNLRLKSGLDDLEWRHGMIIRGVKEILVTF
ncbi:cytochrome P450 family protein [Paenibacillus harenae]|uniref:cytochrome P450 family protein n=1 Tax=Paenibacillus harenae TaxID=306543 RepID=UPI000420FB2E|nr:cytochrome P450 [Paenibacillus harenae]